MCSFITQHNATDVASFEGACNWHADCRNVHQNCCLWIECSFLYHKPSPKAFQRTWQYIQPVSQPRVTTPAQDLHIQHLHLQDRLRPATRTAALTIGLHNQRISAKTETVSGKLICMLVILIGVSTWLLFVIKTSNRFSTLSDAPTEKPDESTLVIGDSIVQNVKMETPATIVQCLLGVWHLGKFKSAG